MNCLNTMKGEEAGYFSFGGSGVCMVYPEGSITFDEDLTRWSESNDPSNIASMNVHMC